MKNLPSQINNPAQIIWDYHLMKHNLSSTDLILVLGSHDTRVAKRGAELFLQNLAPLILFSGGFGRLTSEIWQKPEAEIFANIAIDMGVPKESILLEPKSTNTGENILFSYNLLEQKKIFPKKIILVQKPYMERRTYATFKKQWPYEAEIFVTSPQYSFEQYCNVLYPKEKVIAIMLGDLERIKYYPSKGYQIFQEIPEKVWAAYEKLLPHIKPEYKKYLLENQ